MFPNILQCRNSFIDVMHRILLISSSFKQLLSVVMACSISVFRFIKIQILFVLQFQVCISPPGGLRVFLRWQKSTSILSTLTSSVWSIHGKTFFHNNLLYMHSLCYKFLQCASISYMVVKSMCKTLFSIHHWWLSLFKLGSIVCKFVWGLCKKIYRVEGKIAWGFELASRGGCNASISRFPWLPWIVIPLL